MSRAQIKSNGSSKARDIEKARQEGIDNVLMEFLDTVDDCERALRHMGPEHESVSSGIEQILQRNLAYFAKFDYLPFGAEGDSFDPALHEAVAVEVGLADERVVLRVHRRGWMCQERVVRPASVTVLQGEPEKPARRRRRYIIEDEDGEEGYMEVSS